MQRKEFELIARVVRDSTAPNSEARDILAHNFARELIRTNDRFDLSRFMQACGASEPQSRATAGLRSERLRLSPQAPKSTVPSGEGEDY